MRLSPEDTVDSAAVMETLSDHVITAMHQAPSSRLSVALTPRRCASGESARAAGGRSLIAP